jgi:hypothetical protein
MRVAHAPERLRRGDELVVRQLLVPKLDDVDSAAERGVEQIGWVLPVRARVEDEIEPRSGESCAPAGAVHGGRPYRPSSWSGSMRR